MLHCIASYFVVVVDCGDCVFCLVVADQVDFTLAGHHQGDNLPCRPHKRLAFALELDLTDWVDLLDHCTSLSIEDDAIAAVISSADPAQDGDADSIKLGEDGVEPRREVWDVDQLPCLRPQP